MQVVSLLQRAAIAWVMLAVLAGYTVARADPDATLRHFEIQSEGAALGLKEFARQADISLVFSSTLVTNRQTSGLRGDYTVVEGLRKLLDGSGLSFKQVSATTIAINAASESTHRDPPGSGSEAQRPARDVPSTKGETNMTHRGFFTRMASLLALTGAALGGGHAYGQETATDTVPVVDASTANTSNLAEVVVTGTATAGGVKKLDASFEITTASLEEIRNAQPSSSADLLKIVPGITAESSGGESGANIELAGFPGGGDAPYVTYQINGSPVFPSSGSVSFMENSSLFRIDESIERAEVLQGGPGVVFSNGQLGATANFILRQGTPQPHGDIGLTVGTDHGYRVDGFYWGAADGGLAHQLRRVLSLLPGRTRLAIPRGQWRPTDRHAFAQVGRGQHRVLRARPQRQESIHHRCSGDGVGQWQGPECVGFPGLRSQPWDLRG